MFTISHFHPERARSRPRGNSQRWRRRRRPRSGMPNGLDQERARNREQREALASEMRTSSNAMDGCRWSVAHTHTHTHTQSRGGFGGGGQKKKKRGRKEKEEAVFSVLRCLLHYTTHPPYRRGRRWELAELRREGSGKLSLRREEEEEAEMTLP